MSSKTNYAMFSAFRALTRAYNDHITAATVSYGLSPNEAAVMVALSDGSATASKIALDSGVSKALVSRSVKNLKSKGLIDINISVFDKREQELSLTREGKRVARIIGDAKNAFFDKAFEGLGDQPLEVSGLVLELISKNLGIGVYEND